MSELQGTARTVGGVVALLAVLTVAVLAVLFVAPSVVGAEASYTVLSDSMSPSINAGDVVVLRGTDPADITEGDVITYSATRRGGPDRVTHRVVAVEEMDGGRQFRTKGDANEDPDPNPVPAADVIGTVWFTVPMVGYLFVFAGTDLGLVGLVIVPAILLVLNELYTLVSGTETTDETEDEPA